MVSVTIPCAKCAAAIAVPAGHETGPLACPCCGAPQPVDLAAACDPSGHVVRCAGCGGETFYVQKDFSRMTGCLVFGGTVLLSCVAAWLWGWLWWMLVLATVTVVDALLYRLLPVVTVCYRCKAIHRGAPVNPAHGSFQLYVAEKFDEDSPVMD